MTTEEIHELPYKAQLYINELQRKIKDLLKNNKEAINYTSCSESDNELLDCDFGVIVGKEAHFYTDWKIIKKEALKFSNSEDLKDKTGYNNIDDTDPNWEHYIKS
tara:strand:+ start:3070 stop:3384 length:315 start_codon:yes stop_codon:yes gene_type:complete